MVSANLLAVPFGYFFLFFFTRVTPHAFLKHEFLTNRKKFILANGFNFSGLDTLILNAWFGTMNFLLLFFCCCCCCFCVCISLLKLIRSLVHNVNGVQFQPRHAGSNVQLLLVSSIYLRSAKDEWLKKNTICVVKSGVKLVRSHPPPPTKKYF